MLNSSDRRDSGAPGVRGASARAPAGEGCASARATATIRSECVCVCVCYLYKTLHRMMLYGILREFSSDPM